MIQDISQNIKINPSKVYEIVQKINILVENYAKKTGLTECIIENQFSITIDSFIPNTKTIQVCNLKRIDMEQVFKNSSKYHVYKNSPESFKSLSFNDVLDIFIIAYYPEYGKIKLFINKLLFNNIEKTTKNDFEEINRLYKQLSKTESFPSADEQIEKELI